MSDDERATGQRILRFGGRTDIFIEGEWAASVLARLLEHYIVREDCDHCHSARADAESLLIEYAIAREPVGVSDGT